MTSLSGAAILFDLDGTLVDTAPDLAGAMNDLLAKQGLAPLDVDTVRLIVGQGARALLKHGLEFHGRHPGAGELDAMVAAFIDVYATRIARDSRPFPAARMALDLLLAKGARLAVVTNKPEGLTRLLLDALGLAELFAAIVGYETAPRPKPYPDPILFAAQRLGVPLVRTLMIGDSRTDLEAARAAGIKMIAVRHGYSDEPIDRLGADKVIAGFGELVPLAEALLDAA